MLISIIKGLKAAAECLKSFAVKRNEDKLHLAALEYDMAEELADKRIENAERIAAALIERASAKQGKDEATANAKRLKAATALNELEAV